MYNPHEKSRLECMRDGRLDRFDRHRNCWHLIKSQALELRCRLESLVGLAHRLQLLLVNWGLVVEQEGVSREIVPEGVFSVLVSQMGKTPGQV